jgi:transposase
MAATPKPKPKPTPKATVTPTPKAKPKELKGDAAIKEYQRQISPQGMKAAEEAARRALELKYPGMFIPQTRSNTMLPNR